MFCFFKYNTTFFYLVKDVRKWFRPRSLALGHNFKFYQITTQKNKTYFRKILLAIKACRNIWRY